MSRVGAAGRARDAVAAACLIGGAALYLFAGARIRSMAEGGVVPPAGSTYIQETELRIRPLTAISRAGLGLIVVGLGVGIWSFLVHRSYSRPPQ